MFKYRCYAYILTAIIFIGGLNKCRAQQDGTDSLKRLLIQPHINDTTRVIILNKLAFNYYGINIDDLKVFGNKALLLAVKIKYIKGQAIAYKNLGLGCMLVNGDPVALDYFSRSLQLFTQLKDTINQARVLNNIGYYYINLRDYTQSNKYFNQALDKIKGGNKAHFESILLGNIGNNYAESGEYSKAGKYYTRELALAKNLPEKDALIMGYGNLASLATKLHHYTEAQNYLNQLSAYKHHADFRDRDAIDLLRLQGEIDYGLKNYANAAKLFTAGLHQAQQLGSIEQKLAFYHNLYLLDSATANYRAALINNEDYHKLNDSISNNNRNQLIALYQTRFELEKRKEENQRLNDAAERYKITISQQHQQQLILLVILLIIVALLLYLKRINGQINKKNDIINQQNKVLENNSEVKDKIFSVISHDLRSPIAQIISLLGLWESHEVNAEEMQELTTVVKGSIINTLAMIDNLLTWSKNQLHGFKYSPVVFNLYQLADENTQSLQNMIAHKALNVKNEIPPDIMINADREMIKIVLRNLVSNAIKFTPNGGNIYIKEYIKEDKIIISVEDTGIGIKEKDKEKIFAFTSHTTLGTNDEVGTGIGLKICAELIHMNKGTIWMISKENEGSKFYISLPY